MTDMAYPMRPTTWWNGADPGRPVTITIDIRVPTHRRDGEVLDLFAGIAADFGGGYNTRTMIRDREEER